MTRKKENNKPILGKIFAGLCTVLIITILIRWSISSRENVNENRTQASIAVSSPKTPQARAETEKRIAEEQTQLAFARQLAMQAQSLDIGNGTKMIQSGLLSVESAKRETGFLEKQALGHYLSLAAVSVWSMKLDNFVTSLSFSPDGKLVVSGGCRQVYDIGFHCQGDQGSVRVWDVQNGHEQVSMTSRGAVNSVNFSPDGLYIVSGDSAGNAIVWETQTGQEVGRMTTLDSVSSVVFSPDGKWGTAGGCTKDMPFGGESDYCRIGYTIVWEPQTNNVIQRIYQEGHSVNHLAVSPDGRFVISGSGDNVLVWKVKNGYELSQMKFDGRVSSVAFSPDGRWAISGGCKYDATQLCTQGTLIIWDALTGGEISRLVFDSPITSIAFSSNSSYVVSGSADGTVRVWETDTGKDISRMRHDGSVNSVAFSPDGRYVVSGSFDNTARVWEVDTGKEISRMAHDDLVSTVAFSPDGLNIASSDYLGSVHMWQIQSGYEITGTNNNIEELIAESCHRLTRNFTRAEWAQYFPNEEYRKTCEQWPLEPEVTATPMVTP